MLGSVLAVGVIAIAGCGTEHAVEIRLATPTYGTTGGNLFNCSTPDFPANAHAVDDAVID